MLTFKDSEITEESITSTGSTSWIGPAFITTYLTFGFMCMMAPIKYETTLPPLNIDQDFLDYERARVLHGLGGKENVTKAIRLYKKLVSKGYYEILDILITIFHDGIPNIIEKNVDMTEKLFSMRINAGRQLKSAEINYVPRFPDAVAKGGIVRKLRFAEVKEKVKHGVTADPQNTHDSGVTASVKITIERLQELTNVTTDSEQAIQNIKRWIMESKLDKKQMANALRVIDKIEINTEILSSVGMREAEILALIHDRINDDANKDVKHTLMENLVEELADSVNEQGYLHCTQGRISRMLNALNVLDPVISIKPKWAIRQEMLNDASVTKQRILDALPGKLKRKIENGGDVSDKFDANFRSFIKERFKNIYVDSGVLTPHDLNKELEEWIDHI